VRRTCTIVKRFRFEASHQLPLHEGKCRRQHGHSYVLEVTLRGAISDGLRSSHGMVMDFSDLSTVVKMVVVDRWDHQHLNDVVTVYPTAENLAHEAFSLIEAGLENRRDEVRVVSVKLQETEGSWALVTTMDRPALKPPSFSSQQPGLTTKPYPEIANLSLESGGAQPAEGPSPTQTE
jgi:6-pyruvoyltetrahydropterin/6-carboxytetrahydropterin synthase